MAIIKSEYRFRLPGDRHRPAPRLDDIVPLAEVFVVDHRIVPQKRLGDLQPLLVLSGRDGGDIDLISLLEC